LLLSVPLLVWLMDPGEPVAKYRDVATVVEVSQGNQGMRVALVKMTDDSRMRIIFQRSAPQVGDEVPVRVEVYANGERRVSLDLGLWRAF